MLSENNFDIAIPSSEAQTEAIQERYKVEDEMPEDAAVVKDFSGLSIASPPQDAEKPRRRDAEMPRGREAETARQREAQEPRVPAAQMQRGRDV